MFRLQTPHSTAHPTNEPTLAAVAFRSVRETKVYDAELQTKHDKAKQAFGTPMRSRSRVPQFAMPVYA
jgi:hypothetical protein